MSTQGSGWRITQSSHRYPDCGLGDGLIIVVRRISLCEPHVTPNGYRGWWSMWGFQPKVQQRTVRPDLGTTQRLYPGQNGIANSTQAGRSFVREQYLAQWNQEFTERFVSKQKMIN
ncbi:predicted protein [Histoplasma capsulatum G186AR]|uniref:Uncharacterized protein n=1 Tax=Ajellomyces capsulatus (strain G186AR / H82 / ATCC MYA-2454 / RMSCC 2432) TaxID=447093 RepID=C0NGK6_AJECG|nr:uncharacterized protein HCBG_02478 [Histoplasma capsulatum G186AR]EEH08941.1 predicted protein [Histoplasma capsulatum G186AR]